MNQLTTTSAIEDVKLIVDAVPEALSLSRTSADKCESAAKALIDTAEAEGMNPQLDGAMESFIVKARSTAEKMEGRRKPFFQMIDNLRKEFTGEEKRVKDWAAQIEDKRNAYAKQLREQAAEAERIRQRQLAIEKEKIEIKAKLETECSRLFLQDIEKFKNNLFEKFNHITLENYAKASEWFHSVKTEYTETIFNCMQFHVGSMILSQDDIIEIEREVKAGKFEAYKTQYEDSCSNTLRSIIDRLPGKRKELEEIAAASGKEAERLKKEAEDRAAAAAAERERLAAEEKRKAEETAQLNKEVELTQTLFDSEANAAENSADLPKGREGYSITVLHPAAYMLLISLWWEHEGKKLVVDDLKSLEKKNFTQIKTFCEKLAHKQNIKIDSKHLVYEETFKTTARK